MCFKVELCGFRYEHPVGFCVDRPQGTNDYLMVLFRTNVKINIKDTTIFTTKPSAILYNKHSPHLYSCIDEPMIADWFHFTTSDICFLNSLSLNFETIYYPDNFVELSEIIKSIQSNSIKETVFKSRILDHLVHYFLLSLAENTNSPHKEICSPNQIETLHKLRTEIYSFPQNNWKIEKMHKQLYISRSYFHLIYKKMFGVSPVSDIINSRVKYAKYLLSSDPQITVERVAQLCGYSSSVHFIRQFTKTTGETPLKFKINNTNLDCLKQISSDIFYITEKSRSNGQLK